MSGNITPSDDIDKQLLSFDDDDEGNALSVNLLYGDKFLFCPAYGWMWWTGSHWDKDLGEARVTRIVTKVLKARRIIAVAADKESVVKATRGSRQKVIGARAQFRDMVSVSVSEFDNKHDHLNVANGIIDLRTGHLAQHDPEARFTYCVDVNYDRKADAAVWLDFLRDSIASPDTMLPFLKQAVGYSLTGRTREEKLFYLYGPARAGKGTFTETIRELMGRPIATGINFESLTRDRSGDYNSADLASLKPCRYVTASESNRRTQLNPAIIKSLTGGDHILAAMKYRDHFDFRPLFKIWLTSNWPVQTDVDDDAAWGRVVLIHFPNSHLGSEDKTIKETMRSPGVLTGVLAWAVEGAQQWYTSRQGLIAPQSARDALQDQRAQLDTVQQFIDEMITPKVGAFLRNDDLYTDYKQWCDDNGVSPRKQKALSGALNRKGWTQKMKRVGGKPRRVWLDKVLV